MDWVPWVVRAVLIVVGIVVAIMIWKGKKEGRYQEYSFRFFTIGITAFIMGVIFLIISSTTDLSFGYDWFLTAVGAICIMIGLVVRNRWEKTR